MAQKNMQKIIFDNNIKNYSSTTATTDSAITAQRDKTLAEQMGTLIENEAKVFIVADKKLQRYYSLFQRAEIIEIDPSEQNKTISTVEIIIERLLKFGADRKALLIGFGGGITTDICGFTASIYKRGLRFAYIPTTLLSQCDAAIGGKNGINFGTLKNIIGTITAPEWIFISPAFLTTLPKRELKNGFAEVLKTFIIFDKRAYSDTVVLCAQLHNSANSEEKKQLLLRMLQKTVKKCIKYKLSVVKKDMHETGLRRVLNLGHTFAHAIESCSRKKEMECRSTEHYKEISHGEAVAIGIVYAAKISERLGLATEGLADKIESDFCYAGLPTSAEKLELSTQKIFEAITNDKKAEGDKIHLILPKSIGEVVDIPIKITNLQKITNDLCKFE